MLKITETPERKVYFTSDPHLGHTGPMGGPPLYETRGYGSAEEMTTDFIDVTNIVVRPNDILYIAGDYCLNTSLEKFEEYIASIHCQNIRMIWGNHNNPHQKKVYVPLVQNMLGDKYVEGMVVYPLRYKNVTFLGDYVEIAVNGQMICLFHYPIMVWNEMRHKAWHLCGHSHYNLDMSTAENTTAKILDVGWDGYKKPLSFAEIAAIMDKKQVPKLDHHTT